MVGDIQRSNSLAVTMIATTSCECSLGATELFASIPVQTSILHRTVVDLYPTGNVNDDGPIDFLAPACDEEYTDLDHTLEIECKIVKADGSNLDADDLVGFVNCPLHAMFSQIDVWIAETLVTSSSNTYPYQAYLEKILSYDEAALKSQFSAELFDKDTPGFMDSLTADNDGFTKRREYTKLSKSVVLRGSLHIPFLRQEKLLLNKCDLRIMLTPNNRRFYLMSATDDYKVKITRARMEITRVKINPDLMNQHNQQLQKANAIYPIHRVEMKSFSIAIGSVHTIRENLFTGRLPKRIVIGLVESTAYSGQSSKNPYKFDHFNLSYLCAYVDSTRHPNRALTPNYTTGDYVEAYQSLFNGTGIRNENQALSITRDGYGKGYSIYVIHLGQSEPNSMAYDPIQKGQVRIEMKFQVALPQTVTAIVYAEYQDQIELDRDRNVFVDF